MDKIYRSIANRLHILAVVTNKISIQFSSQGNQASFFKIHKIRQNWWDNTVVRHDITVLIMFTYAAGTLD